MNLNFNVPSFFNEKRRILIESLRRKGIDDELVLDAMNRLPREKFVNPSFINNAYEDNALPIDCGQTISQPYTVAYMTSLLNIQTNDKVLEIGTGSGYQAAVLSLLGAKVFTVERIPELTEQARKIFKELGLSVNTRIGDGTLGWKEFAPYKGIIITAAAPKVPQNILSQLDIGGIMVVPIGDKSVQTMYIVEKVNENKYKESRSDSFKFVPLIGKEGWNSD
ncbi:MAG: protein-L-isoaspartate(D-aspartate) O-methyltransferase [FCB group bacterium]|jgi:protein-L-isoaspartate(D-aspartate) O-methyltransferase